MELYWVDSALRIWAKHRDLGDEAVGFTTGAIALERELLAALEYDYRVGVGQDV